MRTSNHNVLVGKLMDKKLFNDFEYIISYTTPRIQSYLKKLNYESIKNIQEIRIRAERPIIVFLSSECYFITTSGKLSSIYSSNCVIAFADEVSDIVNKMCGFSMHSHYEDMLNGYITLKNGARIGLTGTAVFDKTDIKGIKDIDGINIRIPRRVKDFSNIVFDYIYKESISNLLIVGPPSSGKTTMLKDLTYNLSSGKTGVYYKICVVDERKEISTHNKSINELGLNTDVLYGFPKSIGISMAVRCLSPQIIVCDEISPDDTEEIIKAMNSGVIFIFSIHAKNYDELKKKFTFKRLLENGCIENILFLNSFKKFTIISNNLTQEVVYETNDSSFNNHSDNNSIV